MNLGAVATRQLLLPKPLHPIHVPQVPQLGSFDATKKKVSFSALLSSSLTQLDSCAACLQFIKDEEEKTLFIFKKSSSPLVVG
jgi:hypothetical protein